MLRNVKYAFGMMMYHCVINLILKDDIRDIVLFINIFEENISLGEAEFHRASDFTRSDRNGFHCKKKLQKREAILAAFFCYAHTNQQNR